MLLLLLAACDDADPIAVGGDLKANPSTEVVTVALFEFLPNDVEPSRVEVSDEEGALLATAWTDPGESRATARLIGLPASTTLTARLVTEGGEELDSVEFTTGAYPTEIPSLQLTGTPGWSGYAFTSMVGSLNLALVIDETGQVLWYHVTDETDALTRVRQRPDEGGITYIMASCCGGPDSYLANVDWGESDEERFAEGKDVTHDFVFRPDGGITTLAKPRVRVDTGSGWSSSLVELAEDGSATTLWTAEEIWPTGVDEGGLFEGAHANTLYYEAEGDRYWFTEQKTSSLFTYDRADGALTHLLSESGADYTYIGDPGLTGPHHFSFIGSRIRIHDNRSAELNSRVAEFELDSDARTATFTEEWLHTPPVYDFALGDVHTREDGSMLVVWSTSGLIDDVSPEGEVRATIASPLGGVFGYAEIRDELPGQVRLR